MKNKIAIFPVLAMALAVSSQAQTPAAAPVKVATVHIQNAILGTKDGQKAAQDLAARFTPRRTELEKKQTEITNIQNQMRAGSATMSEAAKAKLQRDYDANSKDFKRATDDYDAEVEQEQGKVMNDLGQKIYDVITKYCTANAIAWVVDVSNQQSPVLWADPSIDITNEIIKQYDQAHPQTGAPAATPAPPAPATKK